MAPDAQRPDLGAQLRDLHEHLGRDAERGGAHQGLAGQLQQDAAIPPGAVPSRALHSVAATKFCGVLYWNARKPVLWLTMPRSARLGIAEHRCAMPGSASL